MYSTDASKTPSPDFLQKGLEFLYLASLFIKPYELFRQPKYESSKRKNFQVQYMAQVSRRFIKNAG
jgi:hypothetical protein